MRIAYLILAHNTPNHLARLVRALDSPNVDFFIHVDRKSDISRFRDRLSQPNVAFLKDRIAVYWGDFSDVEATVRLIKEALKRTLQTNYLCLTKWERLPAEEPEVH